MARSYMEIFSYLNFFWHIYPVTFHLIICSCSPFTPFPDIVVTFLLKVAQNRSRKFVARVSYRNKLVNAAPISRLYAAKAVRKAALQEQHIKEVYVYTYTHVWEAGLGVHVRLGLGQRWALNGPQMFRTRAHAQNTVLMLVKALPASGEKWPGLSNRGGRKEPIHETNKH